MAKGTKQGLHAFNVWTDPPLKVVRRRFEEIGRKIEKPDYREAWKEMIPTMASEMAHIWSSKGGAIGESWPPYTPLYALYDKGGSTARDLTVSGIMHDLATTATKRRGAIRRYGKKSMKWGVSVPQARALNYGVGTKRVGKSPFLGITPKVQTQAAMVVGKHMTRMIERELAKMGSAARLTGRVA